MVRKIMKGAFSGQKNQVKINAESTLRLMAGHVFFATLHCERYEAPRTMGGVYGVKKTDGEARSSVSMLVRV
jgi:hypothetical protein